MFLEGRQSLPGLPNNLRFVKVCDILGSQKFWKYLERVAIQKSLRTTALTDTIISGDIEHSPLKIKLEFLTILLKFYCKNGNFDIGHLFLNVFFFGKAEIIVKETLNSKSQLKND